MALWPYGYIATEPYGYIAIWSYYGHMAILPYGFMAKRVAIMGVYGKSNKNVAIWSRDWIDWTVL